MEKIGSGLISDSRFAGLVNNAPLFKKQRTSADDGKDSGKIQLDDRFKKHLASLTASASKSAPKAKSIVDQYGRKLAKNSVEKEKESITMELDRYYDLNKSSDKEGTSSAQNKDSKLTRLEYLNKLARGEISEDEDEAYIAGNDDSSDNESGDDSDSDSGKEAVISNRKRKRSEQYGPLDVPEDDSVDESVDVDAESADADDGGAVGEDVSVRSKRIAIQNCDWDNIKSEDLMMILQSFCPPGKSVRRVTIYPSDFGLKRMAEEDIHGPKHIWKATAENGSDNSTDDNSDYNSDENSDDNSDENSDDGSEEDGTNELYANVRSMNDDDSSEDENTEEQPQKSRKAAKKDNQGDFKRTRSKKSVGIVFHSDLVRLGKAADDEDDENEEDDNADKGTHSDDDDDDDDNDHERAFQKQSTVTEKKKPDDTENIALRRYELSKLRYYFAIVECDVEDTANTLYEQLDGTELEHSSMTFAIRMVPDDVSFEGRTMRDSCIEVPASYRPPDFIIKALQHSNVECTWDEKEKGRGKLINFSQWRNLNESELQQYIASASEDGDEDEDKDEEEDEDYPGVEGEGSKKSKVKKAQALRQALLGIGGGTEDSEDDFFADDQSNDNDNDDGDGDGAEDDDMYSSNPHHGLSAVGDVEDEDNEERVMSFIPAADKAQQDQMDPEDETPFDKMQRKLAEKKKARKQQKKEKRLQEVAEAETMKKVMKKAKSGKNQVDVSEDDGEAEAKQKAQLGLLFAEDSGEGEEDYDMYRLVKDEKDKTKDKTKGKEKKLKMKGKNKRKRQEEGEEEMAPSRSASFKIDTADSRFKNLFDGDSRFGLDMTSTEYKETPAMKEILAEVRHRREKGVKRESEIVGVGGKKSVQKETKKEVKLNDLASKVKWKFSKVR